VNDLRLDHIEHADAISYLRTLPDGCVNCVVTSPPYFGLRNYGVDGQIGLEPTPGEYVAALVEVFREVRRVLRDDGVVWLNLASSYAGGQVMLREDEPFALRDDLTSDEVTYVLSELAAFRQRTEVSLPDFTVGVDEAVTPLASGEKV
jgi:hypothetical protein